MRLLVPWVNRVLHCTYYNVHVSCCAINAYIYDILAIPTIQYVRPKSPVSPIVDNEYILMWIFYSDN